MRNLKFWLAVLALTTSMAVTACGNTEMAEATQVETTAAETTQMQTEATFMEIPEPETMETTAESQEESSEEDVAAVETTFDLSMVPAYSGQAYVTVNDNIPFFMDQDLTTESFETYSDLDHLGRCSVAYANIGQDLMPTEDRGSIGQVKPTGWHTAKYDNVDGKYLYNRCHLIGYQLTAENANEENLITGTRYLNIEGMLPFENMVADYVKETGNHVLYRVTPVFEGDNLVASGALMEGKSVEDDGSGVLFCTYAYNVQPGISIDYATGESTLVEDEPGESEETEETDNKHQEEPYVLNTNSKKFHKPGCSSVGDISDSNKEEFEGNREELIKRGYAPCKRCNP